MTFRTLGRTGIKISEVSLGSWLTFGNAVEPAATRAIVHRALEVGVNSFDTADFYAHGAGESTLGDALADVPRHLYVLASKVFWPTGPGPNDRGLSRKHIHESVNHSLRRLRTEYLDVLYCHRFDPEVPLEETVTAMEDLISRGKILYWGVSGWTGGEIRSACKAASRYRPAVNQPPYNVFDRHIESDILATCAAEGLGVIGWSPLAQGVLTAKYVTGVPAGSRAADPPKQRLMDAFGDARCAGVVSTLARLAADAGLTPAQLAIGWCLRRPEVTSVVVGATSVAQIEENAAFAPLSADVLEAIEAVLVDAPRFVSDAR